jgi:glutathione S-transferase
LFAPAGSDTAPIIEKYIAIAKKYHMIMEKNLEHHGGKFAAGNQVTIADFAMASYVGNYVVNSAFPAFSQVSAIVDETPMFKTYTKTVQNEFTYL